MDSDACRRPRVPAGLHPLTEEHSTLVIPAEHGPSPEVHALLKVLSSPWLLAQLASLPGYDAANCGDRLA